MQNKHICLSKNVYLSICWRAGKILQLRPAQYTHYEMIRDKIWDGLRLIQSYERRTVLQVHPIKISYSICINFYDEIIDCECEYYFFLYRCNGVYGVWGQKINDCGTCMIGQEQWRNYNTFRRYTAIKCIFTKIEITCHIKLR